MASFVVIEGLDGAGTTTQCRMLVERLTGRGEAVIATFEPTDLDIGRIIRRSLRGDPDAPPPRALPWAFAADRADHLERRVEPALARGEWVVSDRYVPSSLAYQSLDRDFDLVDTLNAMFRVPDLTVFLDVPVDVCLERLGDRGARDIFEAREPLMRVAAGYEKALPRLAARGWPIVRIDGQQSPDAVCDAIVAALEAR